MKYFIMAIATTLLVACDNNTTETYGDCTSQINSVDATYGHPDDVDVFLGEEIKDVNYWYYADGVSFNFEWGRDDKCRVQENRFTPFDNEDKEWINL